MSCVCVRTFCFYVVDHLPPLQCLLKHLFYILYFIPVAAFMYDLFVTLSVDLALPICSCLTGLVSHIQYVISSPS